MTFEHVESELYRNQAGIEPCGFKKSIISMFKNLIVKKMQIRTTNRGGFERGMTQKNCDPDKN